MAGPRLRCWTSLRSHQPTALAFLSYPRRREPRRIIHIDSRLRGNDDVVGSRRVRSRSNAPSQSWCIGLRPGRTLQTCLPCWVSLRSVLVPDSTLPPAVSSSFLPSIVCSRHNLPPRRMFPTTFYLLYPCSRPSMESSRDTRTSVCVVQIAVVNPTYKCLANQIA
jgi:hypothetical protein